MPNIDNIRQAVFDFTSYIPAMVPPRVFVYPVAEVQDKVRAWGYEWSTAPGVYIFFESEMIQYIGKAMVSTGLAQRVNNGSMEGEDMWNSFLAESSESVVVYMVNEVDEVWVPSLECWLIKRFRTPFNKRLS